MVDSFVSRCNPHLERAPTRRIFLKTTGVAVAATAAGLVTTPAYAGNVRETSPTVGWRDDPRIKMLAQRALDAAQAAGATYADVRLTQTYVRRFGWLHALGFNEENKQFIGVRALVNGYWGFAASTKWDPDVVARLGKFATHLAKTNALGAPRDIDLAPLPTVQDGHWTMPVAVDPFTIQPAEVMDFLNGLSGFAASKANFKRIQTGAQFGIHHTAFAATPGTFCTQQLYQTSGRFSGEMFINARGDTLSRDLDLLTPAGAGWEFFVGQPLCEGILHMIDAIRADARLPVKPVDVGRYDTILDARSMAELTSATLGVATELDRAMGFEANASGTSYLNDPLTMLGTLTVGASPLTVTANRSEPGGAATVKWDDEGVTPRTVTLVDHGVLTDYQTTRESAGWLKPYYDRSGRSIQSAGCATASNGLYAPQTQTANLVITPGSGTDDVSGLTKDMDRGILIEELRPNMDFQQLNGAGWGRTYEINRGVRVARISGGAIMFRAPELWKSLTRIGGLVSVRRFGMEVEKGEPPQPTVHSVTTPPARFKELTLVDIRRKM